MIILLDRETIVTLPLRERSYLCICDCVCKVLCFGSFYKNSNHYICIGLIPVISVLKLLNENNKTISIHCNFTMHINRLHKKAKRYVSFIQYEVNKWGGPYLKMFSHWLLQPQRWNCCHFGWEFKTGNSSFTIGLYRSEYGTKD